MAHKDRENKPEGVSPSALIEKLKGKGNWNLFSKPTEEKIEEIRQLWGEGRKKTEIARLVGVGMYVVNGACSQQVSYGLVLISIVVHTLSAA